MFDRITFRGVRIRVSVTVSHIAYGSSAEDVLREYLDLEREDISQALQCAAWLSRKQVIAS